MASSVGRGEEGMSVEGLLAAGELEKTVVTLKSPPSRKNAPDGRTKARDPTSGRGNER